MRQDILAKKLGVSIRSLQSFSKAQLASCGWQKIGHGKGTFYRKTSHEESEEERESAEEAKRRKLIADANISEMKAASRIESIKREGVEEFLGAIMDILRRLPAVYSSAKLSPNQNAIINAGLDETIKGIEGMRNGLV